MGLRDFLFGREVVFYDSVIGNLKTRTKKEISSANCTWTSETQLFGQGGKTVFILEGNGISPFNGQISSVHQIVTGLGAIVSEITTSLKKSNSLDRNLNWKNEFHLAAVTPISVADNSFEVVFEPNDASGLNYVWCNWTANGISNIEFKL
jgi:hypothetical protein